MKSNLFDVYPRYSIQLQKAQGAYVYDDQGTPYLDLYGGHGVISIGHQHPHYVERLKAQLERISFYSNSVEMPIQEELAQRLGEVSGYPDYALFLCNSGAEANENALKLASFHTGKTRMIAFQNSFHGRTGAALNVTDNPDISAPINRHNFPVTFLPLNDVAALDTAMTQGDVAAIIVEGIQGVGGLDQPTPVFLEALGVACETHGAVLILDEVQSGFGRSGRFFAHQHSSVRPHLIPMAKGMGNGFPTGGVLIHPDIQASYGLLGTTFGGNPLACAATLAVLDVLESEQLMAHAQHVSDYLVPALRALPGVKRVKGQGLMLGVELPFPVKALRSQLLYEHRIFTGSAADPCVLRILPPLNITIEAIKPFVEALEVLLAAEVA